MENRDFYITLPSTSSMSYFPDNTLSSFRTLLPHRINLNSELDWEIGLSEIQFPLSLRSINDDEGYIIIGMRLDKDLSLDDGAEMKDTSILNRVIVETPLKKSISPDQGVNTHVMKYFKYPYTLELADSPSEFIKQLKTFLKYRPVFRNYDLHRNEVPRKKDKDILKINYQRTNKIGENVKLEFNLVADFPDLTILFSPSIARLFGFLLNDDQHIQFPRNGDYKYTNCLLYTSPSPRDA